MSNTTAKQAEPVKAEVFICEARLTSALNEQYSQANSLIAISLLLAELVELMKEKK